MKPYKFLIPIGIAAGALLGNSAKADLSTPPKATNENVGNPSLAGVTQTFPQKYVTNGEEHTLLLSVSGGVLYAAHGSHSSHASHSSHSSHHSHQSGT
jgi:hypothetical protein